MYMFQILTLWELSQTVPENIVTLFSKRCVIKGTQAWDIFEFFFDLNQILICPW